MKYILTLILLASATAHAQHKIYLYEFNITDGYYSEANKNFYPTQISKFMKERMLQAKHLKQSCIHIGIKNVIPRDALSADGVYTLATNEPLSENHLSLLKKVLCSSGCDGIKVKVSEAPTTQLKFSAKSLDGTIKTTQLKKDVKIPTLSNSCETGLVEDVLPDFFSYEGARVFLRQNGVDLKGAQSLELSDATGKNVFAEGAINHLKDLPEARTEASSNVPARSLRGRN